MDPKETHREKNKECCLTTKRFHRDVHNLRNNFKSDQNVDRNGSLIENGINRYARGIDSKLIDLDNKPYKCSLCPKQFARKSGLKSHISLHSEDSQRIVGSSNEFTPVENLVTDNNNDNGLKAEFKKQPKGIHSCIICEKRFSTKSVLRSHILQYRHSEPNDGSGCRPNTDHNTNERGYSCTVCDRRFFRKSSLAVHYKHHPESDISKEFLLEGTAKSDRNPTPEKTVIGYHRYPLPKEITEENENKSYKCVACCKEFSRNSSLQWHLRSHESEKNNDRDTNDEDNDENGQGKTVVSAKIPRKTTRADVDGDVKNSTTVKADDENEHFQCHLCDRTFERKKGLYRHIGHHKQWQNAGRNESIQDDEDVTDRKCEFGGRCFKSEKSLKFHEKHVQISAVNCTSDMAALSDAEEDEESFVCKYCDRSFRSKRARSIHSVSAHKSNQLHEEYSVPGTLFNCTYCRRDFKSDRSLSVHMAAQHRDDSSAADFESKCDRRSKASHKESYKCDDCDREFELFLDLREHLASECSTKKETYDCKECSKVYSHPKSLSRHMRDHKKRAEESMVDEEDDEVDNNDNEPEDLPYKCLWCPKSFASCHGFAGHMKIHSAEKAGVTRSPTPHLPSAPESPVEIQKKTYVCRYCSNEFENHAGYAGHMKIHKRRSGKRKWPKTKERKVGGGKVGVVQVEDVRAQTKRVYRCKYCGKKCTSGMQLGGHMKVHKNKTVEVETVWYSCDHCDETYCDKKKLAEHVRIHFTPPSHPHSVNAIICQYCNRYLNGRSSLKTHMYRFHKSKIRAPGNKIIERILPPKPTKKSQVCGLCQRQFGSFEELRVHSTRCRFGLLGIRKRPSADNFKCDYCGQTFLLQCHLRKHLKSRCDVVDLESMETDESVALLQKRARWGTFANSMSEHDAAGTYQCDKRDNPFTAGPRLQRHQQHPAAPTSLRFTFKEGETSSQVEVQFREKPHDCVYCGVCFGEKESLLQHVRTHPETQELSENYIELHAGEKCVIESSDGDEEHFIFEQFGQNERYECSECFETIRDKLQMIVHMTHHIRSRRQNGDLVSLMIKMDATLLAPFQCKLCDERFVNKSYRAQHLRKRHTNEIWQCDVCQKLFLCKEKLKQHCRHHSTDTKYKCEYCCRYFASKWFLKYHTKRDCLKRSAEVNEPKYDKGENTSSTSVKQELASEIVMYRCENCDFESKNKIEMENHSCLHAMDIISCENCSETFLEEQDLISHMESHVHETEPKFNLVL